MPLPISRKYRFASHPYPIFKSCCLLRVEAGSGGRNRGHPGVFELREKKVNLRLLLALASAVTLAGWLASTAAACHSEITASLDCQGTVSFTATAWNGSDATTTSRTNSDVRVSVSTNGSTWTQIAKNHFGSDNGFTFSGTYNVGSATVVWVKVQEVAHWGNGDAPAQARITKLTKGSCSTPPPPPVCASQVGDNGAVTDSDLSLDSSTHRAHVTFTVAAGCKDIKLTLVSYKAPGPTFDVNTVDQQVVFDYKTQLFSAGTWHLDVAYPDCYFQVDFVYGERIEKFGPADSNNFYYRQGRQHSLLPRRHDRVHDDDAADADAHRRRRPRRFRPRDASRAHGHAGRHAAAGRLARQDRACRHRGGLRPWPGPRQGWPAGLLPPDVTNPGTVPVSVTLKDPGCDAGTLKPVGPADLNPGASFTFTCSHLLEGS